MADDSIISGAARSALAEVIAGVSHSTINNMFVRFEAEGAQDHAFPKLNKLDKASLLIRTVGRRGAQDPQGIMALLRYVIEDLRQGEMDNWDSARKLVSALARDGVAVVDGRVAQDGAPLGPAMSTYRATEERTRMMPEKPRGRNVFLVHGRDLSARDNLSALLRAFDLRVVTWRQASAAAGGGTPNTLDIVRAGMRMADGVVVLFTPDDVGYVRGALHEARDERHETEPTGQARLNVVFEAGMAMAVSPERVVLVEIGQVRKMSDTDGLNVIRLHDGIERRRDFAARLEAAGLGVVMDNDDWRDAGSFNQPPLTAADLAAAVPTVPIAEAPVVAAEDTVLRHLRKHFSEGHSRLDTPFSVPGLDTRQVEVALRDLYDSDPPFIKGVMAAEFDYPVVITGLTERGRKS